MGANFINHSCYRERACSINFFFIFSVNSRYNGLIRTETGVPTFDRMTSLTMICWSRTFTIYSVRVCMIYVLSEKNKSVNEVHSYVGNSWHCASMSHCVIYLFVLFARPTAKWSYLYSWRPIDEKLHQISTTNSPVVYFISVAMKNKKRISSNDVSVLMKDTILKRQSFNFEKMSENLCRKIVINLLLVLLIPCGD